MTEAGAAGVSDPRICVIGAGPCGLTTLKNLHQAGCRNIVCYDENTDAGGNWAYTENLARMSVYECTHIVTSRPLSSFEDYPMPASYPDFPSHRQMLAYFNDYAAAFDVHRYVHLGCRVTDCTRQDDGRWLVRVSEHGATREELFDWLLVCTGHHREPFTPTYPGTFAGPVIHSAAYKRPEAFRDKRVLVVGAGNSAADIVTDISRVASSTALSMREGTYFIPKLMFGAPIDQVYAFWKPIIPKPIMQAVFKLALRLALGRWEDYGLRKPPGLPLAKHPTLNSTVLEGLRHGRIKARAGVARYDGSDVHFADGTHEPFDAIVMATGFRTVFPFLREPVAGWDPARTPPLYLKMMHETIPNLFFMGLFQPIGCIWPLADHQARIAALQITGRLPRPTDIAKRIQHELTSRHLRFDPSPRHAIEVDYHDFRRELMRELAPAAVH